ncbi:MAG: hypothetical protein MJ016_03280 [Victivallaceae bacterium]|nr:hypothetical protein [Victivallaceae bacterium]
MTGFFFCWTASPLWLIVEVWLGNLGIFLPFCGGCVLYFGTTTSLKNAAALAFFLGLFLDSLYGRTFPVATVALVFALALRRQYFPKLFGKSGLLAAITAGAVFSLVVGTANVVVAASAERWDALCFFPIEMLFGVIGFPLFGFLMDRIASRIGAPVYFYEEANDTPTRRVRVVQQSSVNDRSAKR